MVGFGVPARIGPFEVRRRIGAGGMAEAFEAARRGAGGFEQRVCVKRVLPAWSTDPDFVALFAREARLAAALSHRNVTRVIDYGEDGGCQYLALELVDGVDLRRLLKATPGRGLPVQVAALIGMEIAEALEHAHTRGGATGPVIHRDVSPANVLLSVDGDVKLTDFGIAKALGEPSLTGSQQARGNVWYMAPEVMEGASRGDARSDQYSLGVVLYQCVSGRRPYDGPDDLAAMVALSEGRRVPLRHAASDVSESMSMVIERLLARRPEDRFPSAGSVAEALAALTQVASARRGLRERVRAVRAGPGPGPSPGPSPSPGPGPGPGAGGEVRARWRRYAVAPGVWAAADRAAAMRRAPVGRVEDGGAEGAPGAVGVSPTVPRPSAARPRPLPRAGRRFWVAGVLAVLGAAAFCLAWLLA